MGNVSFYSAREMNLSPALDLCQIPCPVNPACILSSGDSKGRDASHIILLCTIGHGNW